MADQFWTAWEKIDLSIEGDHVIPVVHNGRVLLFWPKFKEIGPDTNKLWEVSLSWSEYKANTWQAAKVGKNKLIKRKLKLENFAFRFDGEGPRIWVYEQVHINRFIPDSYSVGSSGFSLNLCNGNLDVFTINPTDNPILAQRILIHPKGTNAAHMRFIEGDFNEHRLLINQPISNDEITGYLATTPEVVAELLEGGLGGAIVAIILAVAAAEVLNQLSVIQSQVLEVPLFMDTLSLDTLKEEYTLLPAHQYRQFAYPQPFF